MTASILTCAVMAGIFMIIAIIFGVLKGKAAMFVSGFNTLTKAQQDRYNKDLMCKDMRNSFFISALILIVGGILAHLFSGYIAVAAVIAALVYLLKDTKLDAEKAFAKYKL